MVEEERRSPLLLFIFCSYSIILLFWFLFLGPRITNVRINGAGGLSSTAVLVCSQMMAFFDMNEPGVLWRKKLWFLTTEVVKNLTISTANLCPFWANWVSDGNRRLILQSSWKNKTTLIFPRHLLRVNILDAGVGIVVGTKFCVLLPAHLCLVLLLCHRSSFPVCRLLLPRSFAFAVTLTSWVFFWSLWFCQSFCIGSPWSDTGPHQSPLLLPCSFCHVFGCSPCDPFSSPCSSFSSLNPLWSLSFLLSPP